MITLKTEVLDDGSCSMTVCPKVCARCISPVVVVLSISVFNGTIMVMAKFKLIYSLVPSVSNDIDTDVYACISTK